MAMSFLQFVVISVVSTGVLALVLFRKTLFRSGTSSRPAIRPYTFMKPLSIPVRGEYKGIIAMSVLQRWEFDLLLQTPAAMAGSASLLCPEPGDPDGTISPVSSNQNSLFPGRMEEFMNIESASQSTLKPNADLADNDSTLYETNTITRQDTMLTGQNGVGLTDVDRLGALIIPDDSERELYQTQKKVVDQAMRVLAEVNISEVDAYFEKAREYQRESDVVGESLPFNEAIEQVFDDHPPSEETKAAIEFMLSQPIYSMATETLDVIVEEYDIV